MDPDLDAFILARLDEAERGDRERGVVAWQRSWERGMVERGSESTRRLIASAWSDHPDWRGEWAVER